MIKVENVTLPYKPLTNVEIIEASANMKIPNFRGVYLRDTLPKSPKTNECGILNLDSSDGTGTHWTCWFKHNNQKFYFDSYGLQPPNELVRYLKSPVKYSTEQLQKSGVWCGHICLYVLKQLSKGKHLQDIINNLYK